MNEQTNEWMCMCMCMCREWRRKRTADEQGWGEQKSLLNSISILFYAILIVSSLTFRTWKRCHRWESNDKKNNFLRFQHMHTHTHISLPCLYALILLSFFVHLPTFCSTTKAFPLPTNPYFICRPFYHYYYYSVGLFPIPFISIETFFVSSRIWFLSFSRYMCVMHVNFFSCLFFFETYFYHSVRKKTK